MAVIKFHDGVVGELPDPTELTPEEKAKIAADREMIQAVANPLRERLREIAEIIEAVDRRCEVADGPVTPTRCEITDKEVRRVYKLAKGAR